ncbi:MAG: 2,3-bisphosphoglycerate-independent phosphoglycerate mutase [Wenzhouxiangellaceae bacterium]|nr:2,3-bisphosphoglycerate-independent phosphoglycerate mutase [Wenzhouxiangellaceae bacterium]
MTRPTPLLLLILDGWGVREDADDNAIARADTPNWDRLWRDCPHALLETSGEAVGLPAGQMGNSEVGHMNIGAGRIVYQELTRISKAIEDGELGENAALTETIDAAGGERTVHILGLLSPGGVHSHEDHLFATLDLVAARHDGPIAVHAFLDGRDTPPRSAKPSLERLQQRIAGHRQARLASVTGRYWAMDRDQRWDRIERAWRAIAAAESELHADSGTAALEAAYARDENDEFVQPTVIGSGAAMRDGDSVLFINFRADRARQLTRVMTDPDFAEVDGPHPRLNVATMTQYESSLAARVAFPPAEFDHLLGGELAAAGIAQLRIAETEKYAHVTYFFNGGREQVFDGEDRKLIPSPRVATYDLQPAMSAPALADELAAAIASGRWPVIICNVANPDMVGHTGVFKAAIEAVEAVDALLGRMMDALDAVGGELLVTADHGNIEQMTDPDSGQPHTAHTLNPVPFVYRGRPATLAERGSLRDIAPTVLALLELPIPAAMTGRPLVVPNDDKVGQATVNAAH